MTDPGVVVIWIMPASNSIRRSHTAIKKTLDSFYGGYNFRDRLLHDPIAFPHRYSDPDDIEIAAFIASCFAYGKISLFQPVIEKVLRPGGSRPADFFRNFDPKKDRRYLQGISYRFNREEDVLCLISIVSSALRAHGSLRGLFYQYYSPEHEDVRDALSGFVNYLRAADVSCLCGRGRDSHGRKDDAPAGRPRMDTGTYGVLQFFPSPESGSACKRMNLFLRWMVRSRDIDFGIWEKVPPSKLIIPLDVHIARIGACLGLTHRKTADWKTAKEITEALKRYDPHDPLKYDFALCHHGISRMCRGKAFRQTCADCTLR